MVSHEDTKFDSWQTSLVKLTGLKIQDITGYITREHNTVMFKLCNVVLEDGREIGVEGEHDLPYLSPYPNNVPNLDDDTLEDLYRQARIEDGEEIEDED